MGCVCTKKKEQTWKKTTHSVLMLQFHQAICLCRCQAFQHAGEHPGTSQAVRLRRQHTGTLICLCRSDIERQQERRKTNVPKLHHHYLCACVCASVCGQPVNHCFHFQLTTCSLSRGASSHINSPQNHCSAAAEKKSLVIIMTPHTQQQKPH